jgi:ATP-dependent exoDNAse (exonuclease V) alpha subunit
MKAKLTRFTLSKIFRQKNVEDANLLSRVRTATQTSADLARLNELVRSEPPKGATILAVYNITVDGINKARLLESKGEPFAHAAKRTGTFNKKWKDGNFKKTTSLRDDIILRKGCRVIIKQNGTCKDDCGCDLRYVNGDTGVFLGMESKRSDKLLILRDDGEYIKLPKTDIKDSTYVSNVQKEIDYDELGMAHVVEKVKFSEKVNGRFKQYPIVLGYAMTVNASQGQTVNKVHIVLPREGWMAEKKPIGLMYVGMSRVPDLNNLSFNRPITNNDIWAREGLDIEEQQYELDV